MNAHYDGLAWQDLHASDPDSECVPLSLSVVLSRIVEVICMQTVKQLIMDNGLTLKEIVECHVIPRHIFKTWHCTQVLKDGAPFPAVYSS
jgi:hypothetical protein